jgi:hypothetical protein
MKQRILRTVRNILISIVVLAVLIVGAGAGYIWYTGQQTPTAAVVSQAPQPVVQQAAKRPLPSADAKASASIQQMTSPVSPGGSVALSVRTVQTAVCQIAVEYNKVPSRDPLFVAKTADEFGMVDWTWTVPASAPKGKWPVTVTCSLDEARSAVVQGELIVE